MGCGVRCSVEQIGLEAESAGRRPAESCPEASKVGDRRNQYAAVAEPARRRGVSGGAGREPVRVAWSRCISCAQDPVSGVLVKLAGEVLARRPATGQSVSTFKNTPQLPFEDLEAALLRRRRAPLATPRCAGVYDDGVDRAVVGQRAGDAVLDLRDRLGSEREPVREPAAVRAVVDGGHDEHPGGRVQPVHDDDEPRRRPAEPAARSSCRCPPVCSGTLSSVKLCGEAQADAGTCGPESLIGETIVSVGLGGDPFSVTGGKVYITGPYRGRAVRPVDRQPREGWPVRPGQGRRAREDRSRTPIPPR